MTDMKDDPLFLSNVSHRTAYTALTTFFLSNETGSKSGSS